MLAVPALLAVPAESRSSAGRASVARASTSSTRADQRALERRRQHADAGFGRRAIDVVVGEHLAGEGPQPRERRPRRARGSRPCRRRAAPASRRCSAGDRSASLEPLAAIAASVASCESTQRLVQAELPGVEQELADDGVAEVAVRLLDERQVAVLRLLAQVGELVLAAAPALDLARRARAGAAPGRAGRARRWRARGPPRAPARARPTRRAAARARGSCRRAAGRSGPCGVTASSPRPGCRRTSGGDRSCPAPARRRRRLAGSDATMSAERTTQMLTPSWRRV